MPEKRPARDDDLHEAIAALGGRVEDLTGALLEQSETVREAIHRVAMLEDKVIGERGSAHVDAGEQRDAIGPHAESLASSAHALRTVPSRLKNTLEAAQTRFEVLAETSMTLVTDTEAAMRSQMTSLADRTDAVVTALRASMEGQLGDVRRQIDAMAQSLREEVADAGRKMRADLSSSVAEELAELSSPARALAQTAERLPSTESIDALLSRLDSIMREIDLVGGALNEVWSRVVSVEDLVRTMPAVAIPSVPFTDRSSEHDDATPRSSIGARFRRLAARRAPSGDHIADAARREEDPISTDPPTEPVNISGIATAIAEQPTMPPDRALGEPIGDRDPRNAASTKRTTVAKRPPRSPRTEKP